MPRQRLRAGREFAFDVMMGDDPVNHWHYEFAPSGDGTDVTESFRLKMSPVLRVYTATLGPLRRRRNIRDMGKTLERINDVVQTA